MLASLRVAQLAYGRLPSPLSALVPVLSQQQQQHVCVQNRYFAKNSNKKRRERARQLRQNRRREEERKKRRMNNLHTNAKVKRILSACDFWFSDANLRCDDFLRGELGDYQSFVRLTTLEIMAKFEGWTTGRLIYDALKSDAGKNRYSVICNKDLVEKVALNQRRQLRCRENEEMKEAREQAKVDKMHKKWRKKRIKKLKVSLEEMQVEFFSPIWKQLKKDQLDWEKNELEREKNQEQKRLEEQHVRQLVAQSVANTKNLISQMTTGLKTGPQETDNESNLSFDDNIENLNEEDIDWQEYYDGEYGIQLYEDNLMYAAALTELENLENEIESEWCDYHWGKRMDRDFERMMRRERLHVRKEFDEIEELVLNDDKTIIEDEILPQLIEDDGSDSLKYALVQHKKVKERMASLQYLEEGNGFDEGGVDWYNDDIDVFDREECAMVDTSQDYSDGLESIEQEWSESKSKKKKKESLEIYSSGRKVEVIDGTGQKLREFCQRLTQSLDRSKVKAIGFDVEYGNLEIDSGGNLPEMLQLASPEESGPVGLIWIDKFNNNGKNMIGDENCQHLFDILGNHEILKVGVGISNDAKHLASWWGITDPEDSCFYFSGMVDIGKEPEDCLFQKKLERYDFYRITEKVR